MWTEKKEGKAGAYRFMKKIHTRKKSLMLRLCVLAFSAYVVVSLVSLQMEIADRRSTLASITEQAETQRLANKEIERQIALGDDKDYLARIAREKLDMGRADERVFRDAAGT